jgi:hypothetical protein
LEKEKESLTVKGQKVKASKELNNITISKTSTSSDESNFAIEVQVKKEEPPKVQYRCGETFNVGLFPSPRFAALREYSIHHQ